MNVRYMILIYVTLFQDDIVTSLHIGYFICMLIIYVSYWTTDTLHECVGNITMDIWRTFLGDLL